MELKNGGAPLVADEIGCGTDDLLQVEGGASERRIEQMLQELETMNEEEQEEYLRALPEQDRMDIEDAIRAIAMADYDSQGPADVALGDDDMHVAGDQQDGDSEFVGEAGEQTARDLLRDLEKELSDLLQEQTELRRVQADFKGKYGIDDEEIASELRDLEREIAQVEEEMAHLGSGTSDRGVGALEPLDDDVEYKATESERPEELGGDNYAPDVAGSRTDNSLDAIAFQDFKMILEEMRFENLVILAEANEVPVYQGESDADMHPRAFFDITEELLAIFDESEHGLIIPDDIYPPGQPKSEGERLIARHAAALKAKSRDRKHEQAHDGEQDARLRLKDDAACSETADARHARPGDYSGVVDAAGVVDESDGERNGEAGSRDSRLFFSDPSGLRSGAGQTAEENEARDGHVEELASSAGVAVLDRVVDQDTLLLATQDGHTTDPAPELTNLLPSTQEERDGAGQSGPQIPEGAGGAGQGGGLDTVDFVRELYLASGMEPPTAGPRSAGSGEPTEGREKESCAGSERTYDDSEPSLASTPYSQRIRHASIDAPPSPGPDENDLDPEVEKVMKLYLDDRPVSKTPWQDDINSTPLTTTHGSAKIGLTITGAGKPEKIKTTLSTTAFDRNTLVRGVPEVRLQTSQQSLQRKAFEPPYVRDPMPSLHTESPPPPAHIVGHEMPELYEDAFKDAWAQALQQEVEQAESHGDMNEMSHRSSVSMPPSDARDANSVSEKISLLVHTCPGMTEQTAHELLEHTDGSVREALIIARDALLSADSLPGSVPGSVHSQFSRGMSELSEELDSGPTSRGHDLSARARTETESHGSYGEEDALAHEQQAGGLEKDERKNKPQRAIGRDNSIEPCKILVSLVLRMRISDITDSAEFAFGVQSDVSSACNVGLGAVRIVDIRAGSVIVDMHLVGFTHEQVQDLHAQVSDPDSLLRCGHWTHTAVALLLPPPPLKSAPSQTNPSGGGGGGNEGGNIEPLLDPDTLKPIASMAPERSWYWNVLPAAAAEAADAARRFTQHNDALRIDVLSPKEGRGLDTVPRNWGVRSPGEEKTGGGVISEQGLAPTTRDGMCRGVGGDEAQTNAPDRGPHFAASPPALSSQLWSIPETGTDSLAHTQTGSPVQRQVSENARRATDASMSALQDYQDAWKGAWEEAMQSSEVGKFEKPPRARRTATATAAAAFAARLLKHPPQKLEADASARYAAEQALCDEDPHRDTSYLMQLDEEFKRATMVRQLSEKYKQKLDANVNGLLLCKPRQGSVEVVSSLREQVQQETQHRLSQERQRQHAAMAYSHLFPAPDELPRPAKFDVDAAASDDSNLFLL